MRQALKYPHFLRIGISSNIASNVAREVKAAGKKLHVTGRRFSASQWPALKSLEPDSLGRDCYTQLIELILDAA